MFSFCPHEKLKMAALAQNLYLDFDGFLIFSGLLVISLSFVKAVIFLRQLRLANARESWKRMMYLVAAFIAGYSGILVLRALGHSDFISKLTSSVLFFGGFFVLFSQIIFQKLNQLLQSYSNELEQRVEERTKELNRALKELSDSQEALFFSSKMSALGEMAGGIAHEINSPLAIIELLSAQIQYLLNEDELDKSLLIEKSSLVESTSNRIAKIISGLRSFSRDGRSDPFEVVSLRKLIDETLCLCGEQFKNLGINITVNDFRNDLTFEVRATQISQVVLNLLNNSRDAIRELDEKWIKISISEFSERVEIGVTDSGHGVSKNVREKLFQPFFTTKEIGKSMGMGLSVALGIIQSHQGELSLDSKNPNTSFVIRLPKRQAEAPKKSENGDSSGIEAVRKAC